MIERSRAIDESLAARAAVHAALGEAGRLAIVEELAISDRSPRELSDLLGIASNLLAHHLDVLERVGLIARSASAGDGRRKYIRLAEPPPGIAPAVRDARPRNGMLFLCTHNSARSQLAAALWSARTGETAASAGTDPADRIAPGAVAAAKRAGLSLHGARPRRVDEVPEGTQVVTVCDRAHEELKPGLEWWHWSVPDPVPDGTADAFDAVVSELDHRISLVLSTTTADDSLREEVSR